MLWGKSLVSVPFWRWILEEWELDTKWPKNAERGSKKEEKGVIKILNGA